MHIPIVNHSYFIKCNFSLDAAVGFEQFFYTVSELEGVLVCALILTKPLVTDVVINIVDYESILFNSSAIGKYNLQQ